MVLWLGGGAALAVGSLPGTAEEQAALQSAESGKYIRAREQAEAIRAHDPDSIVATYVLADVFHTEEANHPRALFLIERAKKLLVQRYGAAPSDPQARIWHKRILNKEAWILGEMDRKAEQIAVLDAYDALYSPKLRRLRIWPLMKLGRYQEARAIGEELTRSPDIEERISAYNGLMALEDELLDRRASYRWGQEGIANTQRQSCILFHNTAQAAITLFHFDEAERLARQALKAPRADCPNPSYEHLANIYLLQGEFQKAISAFKKLARWPIDRRYRTQFFMGNRAILVDLLYALGKFDVGLELAEQIFDAPDRTGMTSVSKDDIRFAHGLVYWQLLDMRIEELRDEGAVRGLYEAAERELRARELRLRQWEIERVLLRLSVVDDMLVTNLRPYLRGVRPWYAANLVRVMGPGLVRAALDRARALDHDVSDEVRGYYDAMYGELAFVEGDLGEAVRLGGLALAELPADMRLLMWRTRAWYAEALLRSGRRDEAWPELREVLHNYPTALRHLGVALPVRVTHDDHALSSLVAGLLESSRRLSVGSDGFLVDVTEGAGHVQVCLNAPDGFRFNCSETEVGEGGLAAARRAVDAFDTAGLSPRVALTTSDINSLDGSNVRVNAEQALEGLLGEGHGHKGGGEGER